MHRPYQAKILKAIALLSMCTMLLPACTSWQPISLQSGAVPYQVRITTESERFELKAARLVGDTAVAGVWRRNPRSIRLTDIQLLEVSQTHFFRTIGLTAGILAVAFAVVAAAAVSEGLKDGVF